MWSSSETAFFSSLLDFNFDPDHDSTAAEEFARLAAHRNWKLGGKTYQKNFLKCFARSYTDDSASDGEDPLHVAFSRLALTDNLKPGSREYRNRRAEFYGNEFIRHFGNDASKLAGWQDLCAEVDISPVPATITQCKKALKAVNINLVDLVDRRATGQPAKLKHFPNRRALRLYTQGDKIFPLQAAKKDGFLKALLQNIFPLES